MKKQNQSFLQDRWNSMGYAIRGFFLLIKTENAIKVHLFLALVFITLGSVLELSPTQWIFQTLAFGLILATEALNTAVEKLCDFVHPEFHDKIGFIKDISAGAVTFAVLFAYLAITILYITEFCNCA